MRKTLLPQDWDFDTPVASLVDIHRDGRISHDWGEKRASTAEVLREFEGIVPPANHSLIHVIAMGAADRYGANRNGDLFFRTSRNFEFPHGDWTSMKRANGEEVMKSAATFRDRTEVGLLETHDTFRTDGHVFRDHRNRPELGDEIHGPVLKSAYNRVMDRVELMIAVPSDSWRSDLQKIASGEPVGFSMSCTVPYDICSVTGLVQKNRSEYSPYASQLLGDILKSGHQVGVINDRMKFFDISRVGRNADRIALGLRKVASEVEPDWSSVDASTERDPYEGVSDIPAAIRRRGLLDKFAAFEESVAASGCVDAVDCAFVVSPEEVSDAEKSAVTRVTSNRVPDVLAAAYHMQAVMPLDIFAGLVLGREEGRKTAEAARPWLSRMFRETLRAADRVAADETFIPLGSGSLDGEVKVASFVLRNYVYTPQLHHSRVKEIVARYGSRVPVRSKAKSAQAVGDPPSGVAPLLQSYAAYCTSVVAGLPEADRDRAIRRIVSANQLH